MRHPVTAKTGDNWPIVMSFMILAFSAGIIGWHIGQCKSDSININTNPVITLDTNPQAHNRQNINSIPTQINKPDIKVNVYNFVHGGSSVSSSSRLQHAEENLSENLTQKMSFEEYDKQLSMIATGTDLKNPSDFRRALEEMSRISTEYWGFSVSATTDDVFGRWNFGIEQHKRSYPEFESYILSSVKRGFYE